MTNPTCSQCGTPLTGETNESCPKCLLSLGFPGDSKDHRPPLEPGDSINELKIIEILGRGGMGIVYKARHLRLDRFVAVKVLPQQLGEDPEFQIRFEREAKALASLNHPNILTVFDFGVEEGRHFIEMEFIDGTNLRALLALKKLDPTDALSKAAVLCDALFYAHERGVVHRDIKPENILIDQRGNLKIADFGLAKIVGKDPTAPQLTVTNVAMGTPQYMAPEQIDSMRNVDHRADIYSLGVVLYEMLTGELPLGHFDPPSKHLSVDINIDEVVLKSLSKQPEKRYQTMEEVQKAVTRVTTQIKMNTNKKRSNEEAKAKGRVWLMALIPFLVLSAFIIQSIAGKQQNEKDGTQSENKLPQPRTPKASTWELATLTYLDLPQNWKITSALSGDQERDQLIAAVSYLGLQQFSKNVTRARRLDAEGPNDRAFKLFAFQCKDTAALDSCLVYLRQKFLPHPNRVVLSKDDCLLFIYAAHDPFLAPVIERAEAQLREKLSLKAPKRIDPTYPITDELPSGWKEQHAKLAALPIPHEAANAVQVQDLLGTLLPFPKPNIKDVRSGWIRQFAPKQYPDQMVTIYSLRFFERRSAQEFTQKARLLSSAINEEVCVLHAGAYVVLLRAQNLKNQSQGEFQLLIKKLSKKMGRDAFSWKVKAQKGLPIFEKNTLHISFSLSGTSVYELRRSKNWRIELLNASAGKIEFSLPPPNDLVLNENSITGTLALPLTQTFRQLLELQPYSLNLQIHWREDDAQYFKLQCPLYGYYPAEYQHTFGAYFPRQTDLPLGWQFVFQDDRLNGLPIIGAHKDYKNNVLRILKPIYSCKADQVEMVYMHSLGLKGEERNARSRIWVCLIKCANPSVLKAFNEKLSDIPSPLQSDNHSVHVVNNTLLITFLFGTTPKLDSAFNKVTLRLKAKMQVE